MIALLVLTGSAYAMGKLALRGLGLRFDSIGESLLFATGLGLGIWCILLFLLGHAALFYRPLLMGIAIAGALPGPVLLFYDFRSRGGDRPEKSPLSYVNILFLAVTGIIILLVFAASFAPVTGGICNDEICTHLSIPGEWLSRHGIVTLPFSTSYQAGNAHLLFLLTSCFDRESGPRLVSWLCLVLCLAAVHFLARKFLDQRGANLAVLITAMNPLVFRAGDIAFVDLESALFALLPLCALVSYHKEKRFMWLVLCGFFMGIGCGIKPTNIIYSMVTIPAAALVRYSSSKNILQTSRETLLLCVATALFAAPWPVRDLVLTGSPTFPPPLALYHAGELKPLSGNAPPYSYAEIKGYYDYCLSRYGDYQRSVTSFFRFPWDLTMQPERFQAGDSMGTLLLSLLPLALFFFPLPRLVLLLAGFAAASGFLIYFAVLPEARYFITGIMAIGPVAAYGVANIAKSRFARPAVYLVIAINILFSLGVAIRITARPIHAVFSPDFRKDFCESATPYYETFEYLRTNKIDTVLVATPDRIFYYLDGVYKVDAALKRAPTCAPSNADAGRIGDVALEIDYSRVLGRSVKPAPGAFSPYPLPGNTRLLFSGPDARIYTFTSTAPTKYH